VHDNTAVIGRILTIMALCLVYWIGIFLLWYSQSAESKWSPIWSALHSAALSPKNYQGRSEVSVPTDSTQWNVANRLHEIEKQQNDTTRYLEEKYMGKVVCCEIPEFPQCDVFVCGTLHVAKTSADMVKDVIRAVKPQYVVLELCDARIDSICDSALDEELLQNITLTKIVGQSLEQRSFMVLGSGLLTWMQLKASSAMGSKLGQELYVAAKEGYNHESTVILGDRLYSVTMQRCFDHLYFIEKMKLVLMLLYEVLSMTVHSMKDYISKTEDDADFIKKEMKRFEKHLPSFAKVVIHERDEYMSQIIYNIARKGFGNYKIRGTDIGMRGKIVVVVGAAHLSGISKWLSMNGSTDERVNDISTSSKETASTWPGRDKFILCDVSAIFGGSDKLRVMPMMK
jgi:pheromone shutdown protein TraB